MKLFRARLTAFYTLVLVLCGGAVHAQTTTTTVGWDYLATTPAAVATYQQTLAVDGAPVTTAPTCVVKPGAPADTLCTVTIPALPTGRHVLTVTATLNGVSRAATLDGDPARGGPTQPGVPRVSVTVVVTIP